MPDGNGIPLELKPSGFDPIRRQLVDDVLVGL